MMDIKDAALHRIRFRNDEESETVKVLVDRIRELEASVREWSDRAMEFSNLASKYEEELAAVRQRTLAIDRFHKCGGDSEQDPIERLRLFCSIAMNGQDWLDVEQFFDALRQQQSEPVACEKMRFALENCRLLAARHRKEDWALLILGFCAEGGVVGSVTR